MTGKVSEILQNDCLACCLHKKLDKIQWNGNNCILIELFG